MPLIRIRDVGKDSSETFYSGDFDEKFIVKSGDILIGMDGDFRLAVWQGESALLNQRVCKIESKGEVIDRGYLIHMLPRELQRIEDSTSYATVKHLSVKKIKAIEMPLPPLEEQKRIAGILDEADRVRKKTQALIDKYDELAQSLFLDMFGDPVTNPKGWNVEMVEDVCDILDRFRKPITKKNRRAGVFPYYGATGVLDYVDSWIFNERLVLLGEDGAKWGQGEQSAFLIDGKAWVNNHAHVLRPKVEVLDHWYMIYVLNHINLLRFVTGSTIPKLTQKAMAQINLPLPPYDLQMSFFALKQELDCERNRVLDAVANADDCFNALLQKAFKGELT